jgi:hypothetical protein
MTTDQDKAVALAEKHFGAYAHQAANIFTAMLADHRQQVIEELANKAGVMPEPIAHIYPSDVEKCHTNEVVVECFSVAVGCPDERSVPLLLESEVREAFAAMQALVEQLEKDAARYRSIRRHLFFGGVTTIENYLAAIKSSHTEEQLDVKIDAVILVEREKE